MSHPCLYIGHKSMPRTQFHQENVCVALATPSGCDSETRRKIVWGSGMFLPIYLSSFPVAGLSQAAAPVPDSPLGLSHPRIWPATNGGGPLS